MESRSEVEKAVSGLTSLLGVNAVLVMDSRGEITYKWYRTELDMRDVKVTGEELSNMLRISREFSDNSNIGGLSNLVARGPNGVAVIELIGDTHLLYISADRRANLALLLVRTRRASEQLLRILGGASFGGPSPGP